MNTVMFMNEILNKLKNLLKWLFRWLKYIIIIIIGLIYSLFRREEMPKIKKISQELKPSKKENIKNSSGIPNESPKSFIKNSPFNPTKEELKEEILKFYYEEKKLKKCELTEVYK